MSTLERVLQALDVIEVRLYDLNALLFQFYATSKLAIDNKSKQLKRRHAFRSVRIHFPRQSANLEPAVLEEETDNTTALRAGRTGDCDDRFARHCDFDESD